VELFVVARVTVTAFAALSVAMLAAAGLADRAMADQQVASISAGVEKGPSGLQVPRFVSLKATRVNVRIGPGEDYKIAWVFTRPGLPIEVIQEYDTWRRIRDSDGAVGWVFQSLLSGKRTAVVSPWAKGDPRPVRNSASPSADITAYLEPGVTGEIDRCGEGWCKIEGKGYAGWIAADQLWGVYADEEID
jgi:SH3-like domain-containing protein